MEPRSCPDPYVKTFWRDFRWLVFQLASFPWVSLPFARLPRPAVTLTKVVPRLSIYTGVAVLQ